MNKPEIVYMESMISTMKSWSEAKKAEGFIPTIDLLVEELTESLTKLKEQTNQD